MVETEKRIYPLLKRWSTASDQLTASEALRQIAIATNCLPQTSKQLTEEQQKYVLRWLESNYANAYLWAISQRCVGHPAAVWGLNTSQRVTFALGKRQTLICLLQIAISGLSFFFPVQPTIVV